MGKFQILCSVAYLFGNRCIFFYCDITLHASLLMPLKGRKQSDPGTCCCTLGQFKSRMSKEYIYFLFLNGYRANCTTKYTAVDISRNIKISHNQSIM